VNTTAARPAPASPYHDPRRVAELEEGRIRRGIPALAPSSKPWLDGVLCRGEPGLWLNIGFGFGASNATPSDDDIDALLDFFEPHGIEARLEIAPYAPRAMMRALAARGFVMSGFEAIFVRQLDEPIAPVKPRADIELSVLDSSDDSLVRETAHALHLALTDGRRPTEAEQAVNEKMIRYPISRTIVARMNGEAVGFGIVECDGPIAALYCGATMEHARGRGVQSMIIAERLRIAREAGCAFATVGSAPAHTTERNALRAGFRLGYHKVALAKPGEGLVGQPG
jgi:ribosomal protein S18 acetylase RimI-like enzyme